jgi:hypothetical protein
MDLLEHDEIDSGFSKYKNRVYSLSQFSFVYLMYLEGSNGGLSSIFHCV